MQDSDTQPGRASALILAAQREGRIDPLAAAHGITHKCMVPVAGMPLIEHVVHTLATCPDIGEVLISIENPAVIDEIPAVRPYLKSGRVRIVRSRDNLADSVADAAKEAQMPLLITTADNVLLTHAMIRELVAGAADADVALGLALREAVLAAHPEGQRRFYEFNDGAFSNCNLYWLGNADALKAIEVFRTGGQFVKYPGRILKALGLINLVCFIFGVGSAAGALRRISRRLGLTVKSVTMSDGAAAIDVDNVRSHGIAEGILLERRKAWREAA